MKWVWPFSWYFRIRKLEAQLAEQVRISTDLELRLRKAYLQQMALTNVYTASVASIAAQIRSN